MPRRKPLGWPKYMVAKRLSGGSTAYYWRAPTWALRKGCPVGAEALGEDYADAKRRCDEVLNPQFQAWRGEGDSSIQYKTKTGTFDWLVAAYRQTERYARLPAGTKTDYDRALSIVAEHTLKDGRRFGALTLSSITPDVADRIHARVVEGGRGGRYRTAKLSMDVCRRAWKIAYRSNPKIVPADNPFAGMGIPYSPRVTRAASGVELTQFVAKADAMGYRSVGTAAMIAFYWLPREEDIFTRLSWSDYRRLAMHRTLYAFGTTRPVRSWKYRSATTMDQTYGRS